MGPLRSLAQPTRGPPIRMRPLLLLALSLLAGCATPRASVPASAAVAVAPVQLEHVRAHFTTLSADDMEGRLTGTPGAERAARYIAAQLEAFGVTPGGEDGYFQRVPLVQVGRRRMMLVPPHIPDEQVPAERRVTGLNVVGVIPGTDPTLRDEAVLVGAHYDHLGVGEPVQGDGVYNGADDNASGVTAVLEVARALAKGPRPRRTVVLLATSGEEQGLLGMHWYMERPAFPLERTVANLEFEMIGRPDPKAGGSGQAWLTGYERSTVGDALAAAGLAIVADPHPTQNFFQRSDNYVLALRGIPAHTLSSYGLHGDYHTPADDAAAADLAHMTQVIDSAVRAVRLLTDGPAPQWKEGMRPVE